MTAFLFHQSFQNKIVFMNTWKNQNKTFVPWLFHSSVQKAGMKKPRSQVSFNHQTSDQPLNRNQKNVPTKKGVKLHHPSSAFPRKRQIVWQGIAQNGIRNSPLSSLVQSCNRNNFMNNRKNQNKPFVPRAFPFKRQEGWNEKTRQL